MSEEEAVDELARVLFDFEPGTLSTGVVTASLTRTIVAWAVARGWHARTEARIEVPEGDVERRGFVDVLITRGDAQPALAIEIDSTDKPWSVAKLRYAAAAGMRPVWVRWGDEEWAVAHADVDVIQLPARRRPARRHLTAQLGFWP